MTKSQLQATPAEATQTDMIRPHGLHPHHASEDESGGQDGGEVPGRQGAKNAILGTKASPSPAGRAGKQAPPPAARTGGKLSPSHKVAGKGTA